VLLEKNVLAEMAVFLLVKETKMVRSTKTEWSAHTVRSTVSPLVLVCLVLSSNAETEAVE